MCRQMCLVLKNEHPRSSADLSSGWPGVHHLWKSDVDRKHLGGEERWQDDRHWDVGALKVKDNMQRRTVQVCLHDVNPQPMFF